MTEFVEVNRENIDILLPLFTAYREFYRHCSTESENEKFLAKILEKDDGKFFVMEVNGSYVGYVGLYFSYSSASAKKIIILNDLFVAPSYRNLGYGKSLIDFAVSWSKKEGYEQLRWCTQTQNKKAQKLYDKYHAEQTSWYHYDLAV